MANFQLELERTIWSLIISSALDTNTQPLRFKGFPDLQGWSQLWSAEGYLGDAKADARPISFCIWGDSRHPCQRQRCCEEGWCGHSLIRRAGGSGVWGLGLPAATANFGPISVSRCPGRPAAPAAPARAEEGPGRGEPSREVGILGAELISSSRPPLARTPSPRAAPGARGRAAEDAGHVRTRQVRPEVVPGPGRDGALHGPPRAQGGWAARAGRATSQGLRGVRACRERAAWPPFAAAAWGSPGPPFPGAPRQAASAFTTVGVSSPHFICRWACAAWSAVQAREPQRGGLLHCHPGVIIWIFGLFSLHF